MSTSAHIRLYNTSGVLTAVFDDWRSLKVDHNSNEFSTHQLSLDWNDERIALFGTDCFVELMRSDTDLGLDWYQEYIGFHRTPQYQLTESGLKIFTSFGRGLVDLLQRRSILYPANSRYSSKRGPAETVMHALVDENAGPRATKPPRLFDGVTRGLSLNVHAGRGPVWQGARAYRNLLEVLQEIALATSVDFDVVQIGPARFEFQTYYPQQGTDHTVGANQITFAPEFANMINPSYVFSRTEEVTSVIVLGQGQESGRNVRQLNSDAANDSPWNKIEQTRDARNESTTSGLMAVARKELQALSAKENFSFQTSSIASFVYRRDFGLGDIMWARFGEIVRRRKLTGVTLTIAQGKENISYEFSEVNLNAA